MEPARVPLKTDARASRENLRIATCLVSDWPYTVEQRVFINVLMDFEHVIHHHIQHLKKTGNLHIPPRSSGWESNPRPLDY